MRFQTRQIEGNRPQCSCGHIHQVSAGHVVSVTAATYQNLRRPVLKIERGDLGRIGPAENAHRDREQHKTTTGKQFGPEVVGFTARVVGTREHFARSS